MIDARPKLAEVLLSRVSLSVRFAALTLAAVWFTGSYACAQAPRPSSPVVFTGVSVLPMDREEVIADQTVIIENGRITYVGGPRTAPAGATVVDGRGKFLMPGIAEFHAHVPSGGQAIHAHRTLSLYALAGVTTARGMLGAPMHLALRDSIAAGQLFGPRLLTSGPSFNGNSVKSPEQAMAMVRAQKEAGYDLLKIHPGVPRVAFDSLAATANRLGIPFAGHVPLEVGLDVAITAKHSTIDHLDGFIEAMYSGSAPLTPQRNGFFGLGIVRQLDPSRFQAIVGRVGASRVVMVPTQILTDNYANDATGEALTSLPEFRYWVPEQVASWRTTKNNLLSQTSVSREQRMEYIALRRRFIKALYDAGVPFLLGSDAPQLWNVPGFSAHRELAALVGAGLTPYQALRTGTVDVAKFLKEEGRSGVVRAGARADLILLDANPLQDIANSLRISGVVVNGRWIGSAEREQMLARLATQQAHAHPQGAPTERLGTVHFPTSCSPSVAPQFDRAVALLHSFEFGASIRGFNEVLAADSTCAMAHWGIALSRWTNPMAAGNRAVPLLRQGRQASDAAIRLGARASERERGYIHAVSKLYEDFENKDQRTRILAYERAMNELMTRHPADTEAKIFYALSLAATAPPTDKTYANQLKAGGILEPLWEKQPDHPGLAHYIIHTYDYPALADKARAAARRYSGIAPSAAHALHMPSHTFTRVGMWEESVETNKRSGDVALTTGSIAEALHAADYAMYAYLQMGKEAEAKNILDGLPALIARFNPNAITGAAPASAGVFAIAAIPARWALERNAWAEAAALEPRASDYPWTEAMTYFARALGASRTGDLPKAKTSIDSLASIQQRLTAKEAYWAEQVAIQHLAARAWLDLAEGRQTDALARMREAATREDATEKNAVTPGPLAPARELLGDMLMELKRTEEAKAEYRATLQKEPNRRRALSRLSG